jgi:uncharacterized protein (DUF849 family)
MIVQACINGARDVDFHPALPLTVDAKARDGASCADAKRLVKSDIGKRALRILIEISEQDVDEALAFANGIVAVLNRAEVRRPLLLHGFDATVWLFVALAADWALVYPTGA